VRVDEDRSIKIETKKQATREAAQVDAYALRTFAAFSHMRLIRRAVDGNNNNCNLLLLLIGRLQFGVFSSCGGAVVAAASSSLPPTTAMPQQPPAPTPTTMQCIQYGNSGPTSHIVPTPTPNPTAGSQRGKEDRVLVRVVAAGLNPVDAKDVMGDKVPESWTALRRALRSHVLVRAKAIPGFDFAGVCAEGDARGFFARGDRVFGTMPPLEGTLAEYISAPLDQITFMPRNYSFQQAAALPLVGYVVQ
jgi:hypothetical protein